MKKSIGFWQMIGFIFTAILGTLLHFLFDWTGGSAAAALISRGGSLLPSGVTGVSGSFSRGDTVDIVAPDGKLIARGLVNFDAVQLLSICRKHSDEINAILGKNVDTEAVHRDNLVLLEE